MAACQMRPPDKKALIDAVGEDLVRTHGKRRYYKPAEIRRSAERKGYSIDVHCWAHCFFASPDDFEAFHKAAGETCDYAAMRTEVLTDLAGGASFSWLDIDSSWLDWPDIDLSSLFDWFDFSP